MGGAPLPRAPVERLRQLRIVRLALVKHVQPRDVVPLVVGVLPGVEAARRAVLDAPQQRHDPFLESGAACGTVPGRQRLAAGTGGGRWKPGDTAQTAREKSDTNNRPG